MIRSYRHRSRLHDEQTAILISTTIAGIPRMCRLTMNNLLPGRVALITKNTGPYDMFDLLKSIERAL